MRKDSELAQLCRRSTTELTGVVNELEFLIETDGYNQFVSVRPTESWKPGAPWMKYMSSGDYKDWIRNLRFYPHHDPLTGWGHRGYQLGAKILFPSVATRLDFDKPVTFAGWSLGGGVSQPLALRLSKHGFNVPKVVTFGAPPALSNAKEKFSDEGIKIVNYRYGRDSVPTLMRYMPYEIPNPVQLGEPGSFYQRTSDDHGIELYENALKELEK